MNPVTRREALRRATVTTPVVSAIAIAGCSGDGTGNGDGVTPDSGEPTREFDGWVAEDELEEGWTVIHISDEWEVVDQTDTRQWDPDTVKRFRRGMCKRYFIFEDLPEGYEAFYQGRCEDGVTVTIENDDGRVVNEVTLPEKDAD